MDHRIAILRNRHSASVMSVLQVWANPVHILVQHQPDRQRAPDLHVLELMEVLEQLACKVTQTANAATIRTPDKLVGSMQIKFRMLAKQVVCAD